MRHHVTLVLLTLVCMTLHSRAKILRNNALMTKMISHFQQDNNLSAEPTQRLRENPDNPDNTVNIEQKHTDNTSENRKPDRILNLMQNVLCRNFPTIPCKIIMQDEALNRLIERSIQQITYKKLRMDQTTMPPYNHPTIFPVINSEDLSNFLEVSNTGFFNEKVNEAQKRKKKKRSGMETKLKNHWSHEKPSKKKIKGSKDNKRGTELYTSRKKMRKFYPHKIKYKDKNSKSNRGEYRDYTDEKMSMSIEMPDVQNARVPVKSEHLTYKVEQSDAPVWRIDYMKHGVPSMNNMFGFQDERLLGKLVKNGPSNVVIDENGLEQSVVRKEVLHPDVYIKKNFVRKNTKMNSDVLD